MTKAKSFILFQEYKENIASLSQSQKGELLDAIFAYNEGCETKLEPVVKIAFSFVKSDLDRNAKKYEQTKIERSNSSRLGNLKKWHKDLYQKVHAQKMTLEEAEAIVRDRKASLSDNSESLQSQEATNVAVNLNENGNVNGNINNENNNNERFEEFWNAYNYKKSKQKAMQAYNKAIRISSHDEIMTGVEAYKKARGLDTQYWKHPTTWLNAHSWNDEYPNKPSKHNNFHEQNYDDGTEGFNVV